METIVPRTLGKYTLIAEIARGGMSNVSLASTLVSGAKKLVVVKELRAEAAEDLNIRNMFLDEARISSRFNHRNIAQTLEVGQEGERYFYVMEYLEGRTLDAFREVKQGKALSHPAILRVACQVLAALHYAHELTDQEGAPLAIIHRDVNPRNVFITYEGGVKLLDFGVAKAFGRSQVSEAGVLKGRVQCMSPEYIADDAIDRRADVYAVGVMLREALTGKAVWDGFGEMDVLKNLLEKKIPPFPEGTGVADEVRKIIEKAMSPSRDDRFRTAHAMRAAIEQHVARIDPTGSITQVAEAMTREFGDHRARMKIAIDKYLAVDPSTTAPLPRLAPVSVPSMPAVTRSQPKLQPPVPKSQPRVPSVTNEAPVSTSGAAVSMPKGLVPAPSAPPRRTTPAAPTPSAFPRIRNVVEETAPRSVKDPRAESEPPKAAATPVPPSMPVDEAAAAKVDVEEPKSGPGPAVIEDLIASVNTGEAQPGVVDSTRNVLDSILGDADAKSGKLPPINEAPKPPEPAVAKSEPPAISKTGQTAISRPAVVAAVAQEKKEKNQEAAGKKKGGSAGVLIAVGVIVIGAAAAAFAMYNKQQKAAESRAVVATTEPPRVTSALPPASSTPPSEVASAAPSASALAKPVGPPGPFAVTVKAQPFNAQIFVDDVPGKNPWSGKLTRGQHTIKVTAPGFNDHVETVDVDDASALEVRLVGANVWKPGAPSAFRPRPPPAASSAPAADSPPPPEPAPTPPPQPAPAPSPTTTDSANPAKRPIDDMSPYQ